MIENRRSSRLRLAQPISATAGSSPVMLVDISQTGFQIHHREALPAKPERFNVRFLWNGALVRAECVAVWTTVHQLAKTTSERPTLSSGLRIESIDERSQKLLDDIAAAMAAKSGEPYLVCELVNGSWTQRPSGTRTQPLDGFTVSAAEDSAQVERLCAAYAGGDAETRKLIRTLANLSTKSQGEAGTA
jgi:PilZ domain